MPPRSNAGRFQRRPGGGNRPRPHRPPRGDAQRTLVAPPPKKREPTAVELPQTMTVKELGDFLGVSTALVIKELIGLGIMATINQTVDFATAQKVAAHFDVEAKEQELTATEGVLAAEIEEEENLQPRPPIVTIMGHVDHGKTSLLDAIRQTNVTASEAGGITQHIGAYQVELKNHKITFLDTPGHEAFTAMRARGAKVTDVAVIVVAADDGVQPQTVEAIDHAKAANVPLVVAINKIDKGDANPDRVKQQLSEHGVLVSEWGGDVEAVGVSARRKTGIEDLLETILIVSELLELKANPNRSASGTIVEAKLDKARGPVATVLVDNGTLNVGDLVVAGQVYGKIRAMFNDRGKRIKSAGPASPVEILGLAEVPQAGDRVQVAPDERTARLFAQQFVQQRDLNGSAASKATTLEEVFEQIKAGQVKELNVILKTDVQGSIEPIRASLEQLSTDEVKVKTIHQGTGNVTESDVLLAQTAKSVIVGFNVRVEPGARRAADTAGVDIRLYSIIYALVEDVKKALTGMLEPVFVEVQEGRAEVRQVFKAGKTGMVAGSYVSEGRITRGATARVSRGGKVIAEGKIESLRRLKDDVREVAAGYECGIGVSGFNDFAEGDVIATFRVEKEAASLE